MINYTLQLDLKADLYPGRQSVGTAKLSNLSGGVAPYSIYWWLNARALESFPLGADCEVFSEGASISNSGELFFQIVDSVGESFTGSVPINVTHGPWLVATAPHFSVAFTRQTGYNPTADLHIIPLQFNEASGGAPPYVIDVKSPTPGLVVSDDGTAHPTLKTRGAGNIIDSIRYTVRSADFGESPEFTVPYSITIQSGAPTMTIGG